MHLPFPVFKRGDACGAFEEFAEEGLGGEVQFITDLLDRPVGGFQERLGFHHHVTFYPLFGR